MSDKKEYIEREAIIQEIKEAKNEFSPTVRPIFDVATHLISYALAADVEEVKHAKWIPYEQPLGVGYSIPNYKPTHYCSHCKGLGWEFYTTCPHCGANMDGERK